MTVAIDIGHYSSGISYALTKNRTYVMTQNPANQTGILNTFKFWSDFSGGNTNLIMGTMSGAAPNFTPNDHVHLGTTVAAQSTFTGVECSVNAGDFIGAYWESVGGAATPLGGSNTDYYLAGNQWDAGTQAYTYYATYSLNHYATGVTLPAEVTTLDGTDITKNSFAANGHIVSGGSGNAKRRGFCYKAGASGDPSISDSKVYEDGDFGVADYDLSLTSLDPDTNYRVRAYIISNADETVYGGTLDVRTQVAGTYYEILTAERALAIDNEIEFTPTDDYHPATKKYVDDRAGGGVSDEEYGAEWDGVIDVSPSKNVVYDKIQALVAGGGMGDFMADGSVPMTGDLDTEGNQIVGLGAPAANGEAIRATAKITESNLEDAVDKKHSNAGDHDAATVTGAPLTLASQVITFNYDTGDFQLSGNNLQVKDSGIDHGSIVGLSDNDHPQYLLKADETACFGITIDGGGSEITTGVKGYISIPYACTIVGWYITGDPAGSIVVDVWKRAGVIPDNAYSIAGTERPALTGAAVNSDTNLTTWTTAVSAGDVVGFNVMSNVNCKKISIVIKVLK